MRKIIFAFVFIKYFMIFNLCSADTISNWQLYLNDSIVYKNNISIWFDSLGNNLTDYKLPAIKIKNYNLYKDSLGLNYSNDYSGSDHDFFFIKDENEVLLYAIGHKAILLPAINGQQSIGFPNGTVYIPLWQIIYYYPKKDKPIKLKIYYLSPYNLTEFPDRKERLIGEIEFYNNE